MRNPRVIILAEIALAVALAAVLNFIGLRIMPQGGAVSLVMLPIIVVALRRGLVAGVLAGALYGPIDYMMNPFFVHPAQLLLDYSVAYGAVGLAGLWAPAWKRAITAGRTGRAVWTVILPAVVVGTTARFVVHVISGVIFFAEYAPEGQPVLLYSTVYNGAYMLPSAIICFAAAALVLPALRHVGTASEPPPAAPASA